MFYTGKRKGLARENLDGTRKQLARDLFPWFTFSLIIMPSRKKRLSHQLFLEAAFARPKRKDTGSLTVTESSAQFTSNARNSH